MLTSFLVNVPVLSKQNVLICAPSTVFCGYVPVMPLYPSLNKHIEQARLKNMGRGGGADDDRNSMHLKNTMTLSISYLSIKNMVAKNMIKPMITTSNTNMRVVLMISGSLTVLFIIFLIILPRCVVKPVLITTEYVFPFFVYSTLDPSQIHILELLISDSYYILNLPIGNDSPVKFA